MSFRNILNSRILIKHIVTIIPLIVGIIGFSLSLCSFFFPWYLEKWEGWSGERTYIFYPFTRSDEFVFYSLLFGDTYGLLMTIILILFWFWKKKSKIFSSLLTIGILSLSIIIELPIQFYKYPRNPIIHIPENYLIHTQYLSGFYLNLIAIIFIIIMIVVSFLGFLLYEITLKKNRTKEIGKINPLSLYSLLLLTAIIIFFINFKLSVYTNIIADPEVSLILVTIVMFSITILNPNHQNKSLISSFLIIYFVMILLRLILYLKYFLQHWHTKLTITHFFFFEIFLILLIFSFILFEKAPISLKNVFLEHKISKISKVIQFLRGLESIIVILLIYALIKWFFYGNNAFILVFQEISISLLVLYPIYLLVILSLIIYCHREDMNNLIQKNLSLIAEIKKRKLSKLNNLMLYIVIFLLTIYVYLILSLCNIVPEDMKIIIIERNFDPDPDIVKLFPRGFIFFIILNSISLIIFIVLQKLKSVRFRNKLLNKDSNVLS